MASRPVVVFDTDPGIDDALALAYLVAIDAFDLRAVTVVAGNVGIDQGFANARGLATLLGIEHDVPVYAGCPKPLVRPLSTAEQVHGANGMGGVALPRPGVAARTEHAVTVLDELSHRYAGELVVVAVGPLTNVAAALILDPTFAERVDRLVVMGGAFAVPGNIPPAHAAEANIHNDPEAARVVADSGIRLTMVGLDVTHETVLTLDRVRQLPSDTAPLRVVREICEHYIDVYRELQDLDGCPLHDPLAVAVAADPSWVGLREGRLRVETTSPLLSGATVLEPTEVGPAASVASDLRDGFVEHFLATLTERWG